MKKNAFAAVLVTLACFGCGRTELNLAAQAQDPNTLSVVQVDPELHVAMYGLTSMGAGDKYPTLYATLSDTPLCGNQTPTGPFFLLTFWLSVTGGGPGDAPYPQPGRYPIVPFSRPAPLGNHAFAFYKSYGDPSGCGYAQCSPLVSLDSASGDFVIDQVTYDDDHPSAANFSGRFENLTFGGPLPANSAYMGPKSGQLSAKEPCYINLQPANPVQADPVGNSAGQ